MLYVRLEVDMVEFWFMMQLDVFGEVLDALHQARRHHLTPSTAAWSLQRSLLDHLETLLTETDQGIWEFRGPGQHFTHPKVMAWVAFDRAVSAVTDFGLDGPADHWRGLRDRLHAEVCENAFDSELGAFVQSYGSKHLDAAALLIPLVAFRPADDPRIIGTVDAIGRTLMRDGFVRRYDTGVSDDGLPRGEGTFIACAFWYADNLVLQGRRKDARRIFERLQAIRNDVGLFAEEFDTDRRCMLGNFPQGLSHLACIGTAYNLLPRQGPAHTRSKRSRDGEAPD